MSASLKLITARPLQRPRYGRWDLVRANDMAAWVRANRELLQGWYNDLSAIETQECDFDTFAAIQFDIERSHLEELRADWSLTR